MPAGTDMAQEGVIGASTCLDNQIASGCCGQQGELIVAVAEFSDKVATGPYGAGYGGFVVVCESAEIFGGFECIGGDAAVVDEQQ